VQSGADTANGRDGDHPPAGAAKARPTAGSRTPAPCADAALEGDLDRAVVAGFLGDVDVVELAGEVVAVHCLDRTCPGDRQVGVWIRVFLTIYQKDTAAGASRGLRRGVSCSRFDGLLAGRSERGRDPRLQNLPLGASH